MHKFNRDSTNTSRPKPIQFHLATNENISNLINQSQYRPKTDPVKLALMHQIHKLPQSFNPTPEENPPQISKNKQKNGFSIENNANILYKNDSFIKEEEGRQNPVNFSLENAEKNVNDIGTGDFSFTSFNFLLQKKENSIEAKSSPTSIDKDINLKIIDKVIKDVKLIEPIKQEIIDELGLNSYYKHNGKKIEVQKSSKLAEKPIFNLESENSSIDQKSKKIKKIHLRTKNSNYLKKRNILKKKNKRSKLFCKCSEENINEIQLIMNSSYDQKLIEIKFFWQGTNRSLPFTFKKKFIEYYNCDDDYEYFEVFDFSSKAIQNEELLNSN